MSSTIKFEDQDWCKTWPNVKPQEFEALKEKLVELITHDPKKFRKDPTKALHEYINGLPALSTQQQELLYFTTARLPPTTNTIFKGIWDDITCVACKSGVVLVLGAAAALTGPALATWIVATFGISATAATGIVAAAGSGLSQLPELICKALKQCH